VFENIRYISEETYSTWFRGHPEPEDIILVTKGTPGRVCMVPNPVNFCIAQDMVAIRADPHKIYPKYLFAVLRSSEIQQQIENMHVGTLIPHFKKGDFDKLLIPILDRESQKIIGDVYFTFSLQIELNRQMNETLEAIARALFKSWFVDFDPVRAKAEGRQPVGMDVETAALFPSEFEVVDGREVPKGWKIGKLSDIIELIGGGTPKTSISEYWNGDIPWFSIVDIPQDSDVFVIDTGKHITMEGVNNSSSKILPIGTTIITARGTVGKLALVGAPMAMNQSCYGIKGMNGFPEYYIYFLMKSVIIGLQKQTHGTVFETITRQTFDGIDIVLPPPIIAQKFNIVIHSHLEKIRNNLMESSILAQIRDALLPKLMSGEISIET